MTYLRFSRGSQSAAESGQPSHKTLQQTFLPMSLRPSMALTLQQPWLWRMLTYFSFMIRLFDFQFPYLMLRRAIRERKDFISTLQNQRAWKANAADKSRLKSALLEGASIPTELYRQAESLKQQIQADDINTEVPRSHIDDQYANIQYQDPMLLLTTCHHPSSRLTQFAKELSIVLPNSIRINRGGYQLQDLTNLCRAKAVSDLIILHEHRGRPDGLVVSHFPLGPTIYFSLGNVVLRHDVKDKLDKMPQQYPHLIFDGFSTVLGERVMNILKHLFPVPKVQSTRLITIANELDTISFRHHTYRKQDHRSVDLSELGPRFEMRPFQIVLGTVQQSQASKQWVLRPYLNTAGKNKLF